MKEFIYHTKKQLDTLGKSTVEIGYYTVNGEKMADKVYLVNRFTRRNGIADLKATAICSIDDAWKLAAILGRVK